MTSTYEQKKEAFVKLFASDPDIKLLPLPDSIREKLGIYQDISYMSPMKAVTYALCPPHQYNGGEERKPDMTVEFPDVNKLAEQTKELLITE